MLMATILMEHACILLCRNGALVLKRFSTNRSGRVEIFDEIHKYAMGIYSRRLINKAMN